MQSNIRAVLLILPVTFLLGRSIDANERYSAWQSSRRFTQTTWQTHIDEAYPNNIDGIRFRDTNLNTIWDGVRSGSYLWYHPWTLGRQSLLTSVGMGSPSAANTQAAIDDFNLATGQLPGYRSVYHNNLAGVVLGDEVLSVYGQGGLDHQRNVRDWLVANHPSLLTLTSVPGGDSIVVTPSNQSYWNTTLNTIQPDAIIAQFYPYSGSGVAASYYRSMQWYSDWSNTNDVGMWVHTQAFGGLNTTPPSVPSESELRHQRFTSLAYGARGFSDFLWYSSGWSTSADPNAGYDYGNGTPTPMGQTLAPINQEIAYLAGSLITLTPARTYHVDNEASVHHFADSDIDLPANLQRTGMLTNVSSANGNQVLVGFFKGESANEEYFMVVNKDSSETMTGSQLSTSVTLSFDPSVTAIQRLNRTTGHVETIPIVGSQYTFSLLGGTGDLFKYQTSNRFSIRAAAPTPVSLIFEDFDGAPYVGKPLGENVDNIDSRWKAGGLSGNHMPNPHFSSLFYFNNDPGIDGSQAIVQHPNGGFAGMDRAIPGGAVTAGKLVLEADLSYPLGGIEGVGSGQSANLLLGVDNSGTNYEPFINLQAENQNFVVEAGSLGGLAGTIPLTAGGLVGKNFHLTIAVDLDAKTLEVSIRGDATGSTGLLNYSADFAPDLIGLICGGHAFTFDSGGFLTGQPVVWDNINLSHVLTGDVDNDGDVDGADLYILGAQPGDFDADGDVDGADFVVWQTNFPTASGATLGTGDADGDGDVDGADFVVWQTNFPTSPSGATSIPEPPAMAICSLGALLLLTWRPIGWRGSKGSLSHFAVNDLPNLTPGEFTEQNA